MSKRARTSMNPYEILKVSIKFANEQLVDSTAIKEIFAVTTTVITALYRKTIKLSDVVNVLAESGLNGPVLLSYRVCMAK
ncbi:hypothetical protein ACIQ7N_02665 [Lysinibacillus sp. NPDC095746]|uniref:hypothetical protein n=1 Tax=Lysinibacillus sp. NPDC095746 TaxID=3364134 RepID=UPI0037F894B8